MTTPKNAHRFSATCSCCVSRRTFLASAAAVGATALLPGEDASAQAAPAKLIDTHHHFYPPVYMKAWLDWEDQRKIPHFGVQAAWTPENDHRGHGQERHHHEHAVARLDAGRVVRRRRRQSPRHGAVGVRFRRRDGAQTIPAATACSRRCRCSISTRRLKEIEYVFDTLHADGINLQTNYGDKWLGDAAYKPILEELNRRKAVVYVHPLVASCCGRLSVGAFPAVIEVPHDTTRTVTSLLLSGSFAQQRDIKWLFSHAGGTIPFLAGRIEAFYEQRARNAGGFAPDGIEAEFRRLYYDTANATHPAAMAALMKLVPVSQITYGTDYPYFPLNQIDNLAAAQSAGGRSASDHERQCRAAGAAAERVNLKIRRVGGRRAGRLLRSGASANPGAAGRAKNRRRASRWCSRSMPPAASTTGASNCRSRVTRRHSAARRFSTRSAR